jgi:dTDP-4-amino-4,6-dideoxygalactose transaminase
MITTLGEGWIVSTDNRKLYEKIIDLRDYDKKNDFKLRYSFKMAEANAYYGIAQMKRLNMFIKRRYDIAKTYTGVLENKKTVRTFFNYTSDYRPVFYRYIFELLNYDRKDIIDRFVKKGITVSDVINMPLDRYYYKSFRCKNSGHVFNRCISIPLYPSLKDDEVKYISQAMEKIL